MAELSDREIRLRLIDAIGSLEAIDRAVSSALLRVAIRRKQIGIDVPINHPPDRAVRLLDIAAGQLASRMREAVNSAWDSFSTDDCRRQFRDIQGQPGYEHIRYPRPKDNGSIRVAFDALEKQLTRIRSTISRYNAFLKCAGF